MTKNTFIYPNKNRTKGAISYIHVGSMVNIVGQFEIRKIGAGEDDFGLKTPKAG